MSRWFLKHALSLADYRSYRDSASKKHLEAIGLDVKNDSVYPDLAFSLPTAPISADQDRSRQPIIGVGLMNYHNRRGVSGSDQTIYRDYLARVSSFVVRLIKNGYQVRVLIGDMVWDQDAREDLRGVLEERGLNYEDTKIIDNPPSSVDDLLSQLASVDVVVSSRFHNLLLGLLLGKPVVAISYHEKFQPLMNGVGLGGFCQDIEHIDVEELVGKVIKLRENEPGFKVQIARQTETYRAQLGEQYDRILKLARPTANLRMA